jgi:hypothetical protein
VTQAVLDGLVVDERVVDEAPGAQARLQRAGDGLGDRPARLAVRILQPAQSDVERHLILGHRHPHGGHQLAEQPRPRRLRGDRLLGEDRLLRLGQKVGAVAAGAAQVVRAEAQLLAGEQLLGAGVVQRRPLQLKEQQLGLDLGRALLDELEQRAARRIGGVGGELQRGVGAGLADELVDRRQLMHGRGQAGGVQLGEPALVGGGERLRPAQGLGELPLNAVLLVAVDERSQIPAGVAKLRIGKVLGGGRHDATRLAAPPRRKRRLTRRRRPISAATH